MAEEFEQVFDEIVTTEATDKQGLNLGMPICFVAGFTIGFLTRKLVDFAKAKKHMKDKQALGAEADENVVAGDYEVDAQA